VAGLGSVLAVLAVRLAALQVFLATLESFVGALSKKCKDRRTHASQAKQTAEDPGRQSVCPAGIEDAKIASARTRRLGVLDGGLDGDLVGELEKCKGQQDFSEYIRTPNSGNWSPCAGALSPHGLTILPLAIG
jgi:hypothetical protein